MTSNLTSHLVDTTLILLGLHLQGTSRRSFRLILILIYCLLLIVNAKMTRLGFVDFICVGGRIVVGCIFIFGKKSIMVE